MVNLRQVRQGKAIALVAVFVSVALEAALSTV